MPNPAEQPGSRQLFTPVHLGALSLPNRLVMAPLTRLRASHHGVPTGLMVEHYRQRASMGLIITEGTWPVREGRTWITQPGIETQDHVVGWRAVADAVHAEGGRIAMQIMHGGRVSHPELTGTGRIVGASAIPSPRPIRIAEGPVLPPAPHALDAAEITTVIEQFVSAARRAIDAGMDAVQIHGANGYLVHQFFSPAANQRTDAYGGTPSSRARFAIELTHAVAEAVGAHRTGIRLSPDTSESGTDDTLAAYGAFADAVSGLGLAFVDVLHEDPVGPLVQEIRRISGAPLIANSGFATPTTRAEAAMLVGGDHAEAVGVGRPIIANPDLVERWRQDLPENPADPSTFYTDGPLGYTDYPSFEQETARASA